MADKKNYQTVIKVDKSLTEDERSELAGIVIDYIIKRSQSGISRDGSAFPNYSKSYIESLDFKNGKQSKKPNLTLTGDMLNLIEYIDDGIGYITIGYNGGDQAEKVEGNQIGSYGGKPNEAHARPFLGIQEKDLERLTKIIINSRDDSVKNFIEKNTFKYDASVKTTVQDSQEARQNAADRATANFFKKLFGK